MMLEPSDQVHFPGDPSDRGTVFNDGGRLAVLWHRPGSDASGDPDFSPIDASGVLLDLDGVPSDREGPLRVEPVLH